MTTALGTYLNCWKHVSRTYFFTETSFGWSDKSTRKIVSP